KRLWFLDQFEPGNSVYNIPSTIPIEGNINFEALERSFIEIIKRHEVLRTTFIVTIDNNNNNNNNNNNTKNNILNINEDNNDNDNDDYTADLTSSYNRNDNNNNNNNNNDDYRGNNKIINIISREKEQLEQ